MAKVTISGDYVSDKDQFPAKRIYIFIGYVLMFFGLYLSSIYNYLLFHTFVELFSVIVGYTIFIIAWNSRRIFNNNYLLFLGIAFFFVATLDLIHTLSYSGLPIFTGYDADLPTQLWISARYMESLTLLAAPIVVQRQLKSAVVLSIYTTVTVLIVISTMWWPVFPSCYIEGIGLTPFKKISEYIISFILLVALFLLYRHRFAFDKRIFRLLAVSIILTIVAELAFTFYVSVYGLSNLLGHFLKLASYLLIYLAIVRTGLREPFRLLFKDLKESHDRLKQSEEKYRQLFEFMEEGFFRTDKDGKITLANKSLAKMLGFSSPEEIIDLDITTLYGNSAEGEEMIQELQNRGVLYSHEILTQTRNDTIFWALCNLKNIEDGQGNVIGTEGLIRDITTRKQIENKLLREKERLEKALAEIRTLRGILPICAECKKIRDDKGYWNQIELYIRDHSDAEFSHGLCPDCVKKYELEDD